MIEDRLRWWEFVGDGLKDGWKMMGDAGRRRRGKRKELRNYESRSTWLKRCSLMDSGTENHSANQSEAICGTSLKILKDIGGWH